METSGALALLGELEDIISSAKKNFSLSKKDKITLDRDFLLSYILDIKKSLPDDLNQAKWLTEERQRILDEAKVKAEEIEENAKVEAFKLVSEDEITRAATLKAKELLARASEDADMMRNRSIDFAQKRFMQVVDDIQDISNEINKRHNDLENMKVDKDKMAENTHKVLKDFGFQIASTQDPEDMGNAQDTEDDNN